MQRFAISDQGRAGDRWLIETARWAWRTKIQVHLNIDLRMRLWTAAETEAVRVFASNLRDLLLAAPAGARVTMGLDPGYRSGVKVAVVDATGKVVATTAVYPHEPQRQWDEALATLGKLCVAHRVDLIAIGNGTASRETDRLAIDLVKLLPDLKMSKIVVSEAGASVYSASAFASEELPELDVTLRGAVSIARRLQDPLAELVKIDPKAIGVGQYQHDLGESKLARSLDAVVEDCVNAVGVDANTASAPLLARVSGIGAGLAQSIVQHRDANGPFKSRKALKEVPRLGPKAFEQCAGFLRINGGTDPLDASGVHPESYPVVRRILEATKSDIKALIGNAEIVRQLKPQTFVDDTFGLPTVTDILRELEKPGRDPRPAFKTAVLKEGVETIKDLKRGMILEGTVTNVAAFGAFVDIGVHQDGLVHVSAMSKTFIKDPREVVKSGDIVKVKVLDLEVARKRIALTLRLDDETAAEKRERPPREAASTGACEGTASHPRSRRSSPAAGRSPKRCAAPARRSGRGKPGGSSARRQQIHLGVGDDQAVGEDLREVAHDGFAGAGVLLAKALEIPQRDFVGGRGHVRHHVGGTMRFQQRHLAEGHAGRQRRETHAVGQGDMNRAAAQEEQRGGGLAGRDDLFAGLVMPDRADRAEIGKFLRASGPPAAAARTVRWSRGNRSRRHSGRRSGLRPIRSRCRADRSRARSRGCRSTR